MNFDYDKTWYDGLVKPTFQPPAWVFAPVWTILYIMMGGAFCLMLLKGFSIKTIFAVFLFVLQLLVNIQWSPVFFRDHNLRKAFLLCVILTLLVFFTMLIFYWISKIAGVLLIPYFLWCCFATVLSFSILELNEW